MNLPINHRLLKHELHNRLSTLEHLVMRAVEQSDKDCSAWCTVNPSGHEFNALACNECGEGELAPVAEEMRDLFYYLREHSEA